MPRQSTIPRQSSPLFCRLSRGTVRRPIRGCSSGEEEPGSASPSSVTRSPASPLSSAAQGLFALAVAGLALIFENGAMVLEGETAGPVKQRIRWYQVDGDPDRVRQLWESSDDGGKSWTVAFDGLYVRKKE